MFYGFKNHVTVEKIDEIYTMPKGKRKKEIKVSSKLVNTNPNIMKNTPVEQYVLKAVEWLKEGMSHSAIKEMILLDKKKGPVTPEAATSILNEAIARMKVEYAKDRQHIVALHTQRYDRAIKKLLNINVDSFDKMKQRELKINAYLQVLETLFRKEKLLQMHTKSFQVRINNTVNAKVREKKQMFDLSKLTLEEKINFLQLMQKAKRGYNELQSVTLIEKKQKEVIEDIGYEEVQVPQLELYKPKVEQEDTKSTTTLLSVQQKLADTLRRKAEEEFKRKGAKV